MLILIIAKSVRGYKTRYGKSNKHTQQTNDILYNIKRNLAVLSSGRRRACIPWETLVKQITRPKQCTHNTAKVKTILYAARHTNIATVPHAGSLENQR